jgi:DNA helicase-2/ATP-dependent DNA helicase PcrA
MTVALSRQATDAHSAIDAIVGSLDAEQRAAAELPDGPAQIIAPAGSGKTTTLVARLGVLLARGVRPERICVVTFNRAAALELSERIERRLDGVAAHADRIEVRTLHALSRRIVLDAGGTAEVVADRSPLLRAARRSVGAGRDHDAPPLPEVDRLDAELSAWRIEGREPSIEARPVLNVYATLLAARGACDFDDLVAEAARLLEDVPAVRDRWQARFSHVCVDEFQDVDAAQLRLVRLLAAPQDNLFVVGDDDQTIYAWRLADVRRILDFGVHYPTARRVQLATNYRCPATVVDASARLIAVNRERFAKEIRPAPGLAPDRTSLAAASTASPDWAEGFAWLAAREAKADRSLCFVARTRAELEPVRLALVRAGIRHATAVPPLVEAGPVRRLLEELEARPIPGHPFNALVTVRDALGWRRGEPGADALSDDELAGIDALLGWATAYRERRAFLDAAAEARKRLAALVDPQAPVELTTIHGAKGREWETVVVVGFEEDRFPNRRALVDAREPERAIEEERRLAYVALTRATRRLIVAFDPRRPSRFLAEMGYSPTSGATTDR